MIEAVCDIESQNGSIVPKSTVPDSTPTSVFPAVELTGSSTSEIVIESEIFIESEIELPTSTINRIKERRETVIDRRIVAIYLIIYIGIPTLAFYFKEVFILMCVITFITTPFCVCWVSREADAESPVGAIFIFTMFTILTIIGIVMNVWLCITIPFILNGFIVVGIRNFIQN